MVRNTTTASARLRDGTSPASLDWSALPPAVGRIRSRILQAVASRTIAELLIPIQWNEVPPLFTRGQAQALDPIAFLKTRSFDGEGREMLRILGAVLRQPYGVQNRGGSLTYLWPQFPVVPEVAPLPRERLNLWRCVRFADLALRDSAGAPLVHRISIGVDGTWHYFWAGA